MRCAMALHKGVCYLRHERVKFLLYALDWLSILLLPLGVIGLLASCFIQAAQLGFYAACRKPRAWVSQKLFFFAFPLGLASYRVRVRTYTEI